MLRVVALGGCPLHHPLNCMRRDKIAAELSKAMGFRAPPFALSSGAALQTVRFCRGDLEIPANIRELCYADPKHVPKGNQQLVIAMGDIVLVEMSTPVEVVYRGFILNNNRLKDRFALPLKQRIPSLGPALSRWRGDGLQKRNHAKRSTAAEYLLANIPDTDENSFARDVIENTWVRETKTAEIVADLDTLRTELPLPLGIVLHNFNYMPDGRPISWPADFRRNTIEAARQLGVPLYDPADLVASYGAVAALGNDMRHYSPPFRAVLAEEMHRKLIAPLVAQANSDQRLIKRMRAMRRRALLESRATEAV